jgi:hypothetical protein
MKDKIYHITNSGTQKVTGRVTKGSSVKVVKSTGKGK